MMSLGFTKYVRLHKLRRLLLSPLLVVGAILAPTSAAIAQDMAFDLDEAETEVPAEEEAPADEGAAEGEAVEGGDVAAEGGGAVGGDIFDELTSEDTVDITGDDTSLPKETEVVEEIYAVQRMYVLRTGRFELSPSVAFTVNDPYVSHPAAAAALNFWVTNVLAIGVNFLWYQRKFTNVLAIGVNFLWYQGIETESDLNFSVRRSARLAVPITEYQMGGHLNFTYVPIYGKFTMFNDAIFQWDSYLMGGVGMVRTRPVAVVDPAVRSFDFDWRVAFNVGIGIRVFLTKWLTVNGELRDYMYLEKLENLEVALGSAREEKNTWIDENATLTNNVSVHLGVSMFIPFGFDYSYPK